tara:strand:+ start:5244 stop:5630 length:387 start_codon:yes stop_codon:yes gene_type:complete
MKITAQQVSTQSSHEVLHSNPECADLDNPTGDFVRPVARVLIELDDGSRYVHDRGFSNPVDGDDKEVEAKVEALADRVAKAGEINLEHWVETYASYGSAAWRGEERERRHNFEVASLHGDEEEMDRYC